MRFILLFLLHIRASLVVATTLPIAVLIAFIAMHRFGVDANIMSLAGIAIAIGTMVDMGIIISENIFRGIADWEENGRPDGNEGRLSAITKMAVEVAPAVITAVCTTVISFLPVFFLTGRDYRLFAPLAWTKTFSLVASLIVAVLLVPMLSRLLLKNPNGRGWGATTASVIFGGLVAGLSLFVWKDRLAEWSNHFAIWVNAQFKYQLWDPEYLQPVPSIVTPILLSVAAGLVVYLLMRETVRPVERNIVARLVNFFYEPTLRCFLRFKRLFLAVPLIIVLVGVVIGSVYVFGWKRVTTSVEYTFKLAGADLNQIESYVEIKHSLMQLKKDDWIALDEGSWFYMPSLYPAASFSQAMETLQTQDAMIKNIPEVENVLGKIGRVESALDPAPAGMIETYVMLKPRDQWRPGITEKKIWQEINEVATLPGIPEASELQPISGRVVMLQSGTKASMAVRIYGDTLDGLSEAADALSLHLKQLPSIKPKSVNPDIVLGKLYIEFTVDRHESARYGMTVLDVNEVIEVALGGKTASTTVEGRQRTSIQVRYQRNYREDIDQLKKIPVVTNTGEVVPLGRLADMTMSWGPAVVNSEDAQLACLVNFSLTENADPLEAAEEIKNSISNARASGVLKFPEGNYRTQVIGSFEDQVAANRRLLFIIPIVLFINAFIIYLQFRRIPLTLVVFAGIPVAFAGGMIALAIGGVELNTAVWVGFIALFGIAIDDGVVIATFLDQTLKDHPLRSTKDIRDAVVSAGLKRIRPCLMTTFTTVIALLPVLYATGRGADVARAMAIPVFGGMVIELITLFVVPVLYCGFLEFKMNAGFRDSRFIVEETTDVIRAA